MIELYSDTLEAPGDGPDNEILSHFAPHLFTKDADATIAVHERKGTAIVRYCADNMADQSVWERTCSTNELLRRIERGESPRRVVLVDDLLKTGNEVSRVVRALRRAGYPTDRVSVVVLASHCDFDSKELVSDRCELHIWRRGLSDAAYRAYRARVISHLVGAGSYLDTEHPELPLVWGDPSLYVKQETRGDAKRAAASLPSIGRVLRALGRSGHVCVLPPSPGLRASIFYPETPRHPCMSFQRAGTVRKVRLVENRDGGAHLLPISLPAIPAGLEWSVSEEELLSAMDPSVLPQVQRLFARPPEGDREVFLRNALVSSLIPLSWALRDLAEALPSSAMSAVREDRLRHLVVTYPGLSVGTLALLLRSVLHNAVRMASDSGMASLVHDSVPALDWLGLDDLGDANALLHAIAFIVDDRLLDCTEPAGLHHLGAYGITHTELLAIGGRLGLSIARTSGLLDLLIERAMISTKIGRLPNGELTRLYKPDGELTTDRLRMERRVSV